MSRMGFDEPRFKMKYSNEPVTAIVNGRRCNFKSKLEYRWSQYLDFLLTNGEMKDFFYEFHTFYFSGEKKPTEYTPDFLIRNNDNSFEYHETKGALSAYDIKKFKRMFEERPAVKITLVFWSKPKISVNKRRLLERYCHRIIYNGKTVAKNVPMDMS